MTDAIERFSLKEYLEDAQCVVVCILGYQDSTKLFDKRCVLGQDSEPVYIDDVIDMFTDEKNPFRSLPNNVPIILFFMTSQKGKLMLCLIRFNLKLAALKCIIVLHLVYFIALVYK